MTLQNARHVEIKILAHRRPRIAAKDQALVITSRCHETEIWGSYPEY